ncbi:MAG: prepilin-type N-terminal cleavage/methylation domain-containing protein [Planctomycetota bacterium]|nr:prepilin-type N-terminal cleavage/methylation domain-containing protein [Planctomycetota bacterium]
MKRGFTLIEVAVVVTIMGLLLGLAIPKLAATRERVHVDLATSRLQTVWNAQRFYWLEHRAYADSMDLLQDAGLLDGAFAKHDTTFEFSVSGSATTFLATAERTGAGWTGSLTIDESGIIAGFVQNGAGRRVLP